MSPVERIYWQSFDRLTRSERHCFLLGLELARELALEGEPGEPKGTQVSVETLDDILELFYDNDRDCKFYEQKEKAHGP